MFFLYAIIACLLGYGIFMFIMYAKLDRRCRKYENALNEYGGRLAQAIQDVYAKEGELVTSLEIKFDPAYEDNIPRYLVQIEPVIYDSEDLK